MSLEVGKIAAVVKVDADGVERELVSVAASMGKVHDAAVRADKATLSLAQAHNRLESASAKVAKAESDLNNRRASGKATAEQIAKAEERLAVAKRSETSATLALQKAEITATQARKQATAAAHQQTAAQEKQAAASGKVSASLRNEAQAWQTVGGLLAAAGAATTATVVATAKAGVAYNTLQQTSRAALKTMLGDSKAVNAQMAELDAFARTSPFSKQTFITAQQQMLAFGVETQKVVPYLSAINDATAAAGGNSQTLGELAFVMAQISAAGKITGQDLIQFGQRGVNAAELIGSQMGMTGAEIKQAITDGALSADVALDALAAGMSEKFKGASANVKETWTGATDRVSSAIRDVSALLAAPLVDPQSGGAAVGWANDLADALRNVEGILTSTPAPVRVVTTGLVAAGGGASALAGGLLLALPRIVETRVALDALAASGSRIPGAFGKVTKAAKVAGGALAVIGGTAILTGWMQSVTDIETGGDRIVDALARTGSAQEEYDAINAMFAGGGKGADWLLLADEQASSIQSIGDALERLKASESEGTIKKIFGAFNESGDNWLGGNAAWKQTEESLKALDAAMASIVQSGDVDALAEAQGFLATEAGKVGWSLDDAASRMPLYAEALANVGAASADAGTAALQAAADQIKGAEDAKKAQEILQASYEEFADLYGGAAAAFIDLGGAYDGIIEKNKALAQSTADATEDSKDSWEDYYKDNDVSLKDYLKSLDEQVAAQTEWKDNMSALAGRVSADTLRELGELGPKGAPLVAELVNATDKQLAKLDMTTAAKRETDGFIATILGAQGDIPLLEVHTALTGWDTTYSRLMTMQSMIRGMTGKSIRIATGVGGQGGTTFAEGGAVIGAGTSTSDSILARLSNGEHVWTEKEVRAIGGHGALERMRAMALTGALPQFATGGAVGKAKADPVETARQRVIQQRRVVNSARRLYDDIDGTKANRDAKKAAKREFDAEKKELDRREKALKVARDKRDDAKEAAARISAERRELTTAVRRGDLVEQATSGIGGAFSVVDRLYDQSRNKDLSKKSRDNLASVAREAERNLSRLYSQAEGLEDQLSKAKDHVEALASIKADVAGVLGGEFRLGSALGQKTQWGHDKPVTGSSLLASAQAKAASIKALGSKLDRLAALGVSGAILQDIAREGADGGNLLADALLGDTSTLSALNAAYEDINTWSQYAGEAATKNTTVDGVLYKDGLPQADAAARFAKDQLDAVNEEIKRWAVSLEGTLLGALGLRKNSKGAVVKKASGGRVGGGIAGVDSVSALLMPEEHVLDVDDVRAAGGHGAIYAWRQSLHSGVPVAFPGTVPGTAGARSAAAVASAVQRVDSTINPDMLYAAVYGAVRAGMSEATLEANVYLDPAEVHRRGAYERGRRGERASMQREVGLTP